MRIVIDESDRVTAWVCEAVNATFYGPHRGIGIERDGKLVAGVVLHDFNGSNIELTVRGRAFFGRTFQAYIREYGRANGVRHVTVRQRSGDRHLNGLAERMGFSPEGRQPDFYPDGGDSVLYGMRL